MWNWHVEQSNTTTWRWRAFETTWILLEKISIYISQNLYLILDDLDNNGDSNCVVVNFRNNLCVDLVIAKCHILNESKFLDDFGWTLLLQNPRFCGPSIFHFPSFNADHSFLIHHSAHLSAKFGRVSWQLWSSSNFNCN